MGSDNWLLFKSPKEARRAELYLAPLDGDILVQGRYSCWFTWAGAKRLEIGGNMGSSFSGILDVVQREVCLRFDVRRIGSDSVGWYRDSGCKETVLHPGYPTWTEWAKNYKVEWNLNLPDRACCPPETFEADYTRSLAEFKDVEASVMSVFKKLDALPYV